MVDPGLMSFTIASVTRSGAGLPGLPLALAAPCLEAVLLEPRAKRAAFLRAAVSLLGLTNVQVLEQRLESLQPAGYELVCVRGLDWRPLAAQIASQLGPWGRLLTFEKTRIEPEPAPEWRLLRSFPLGRLSLKVWLPTSAD